MKKSMSRTFIKIKSLGYITIESYGETWFYFVCLHNFYTSRLFYPVRKWTDILKTINKNIINWEIYGLTKVWQSLFNINLENLSEMPDMQLFQFLKVSEFFVYKFYIILSIKSINSSLV